VGGWPLLSMSEEGQVAVQKRDLMAQLKLHCCAIEHALSFRNYGVFLEPLMAKQDDGHAGKYH
jgi:hypothetical protein